MNENKRLTCGLIGVIFLLVTLYHGLIATGPAQYFVAPNAQKIFYFQGKSYLLDIIDFQLFRSNKKNNKLIELKKHFEQLEKPLFPIKAKIIMEKYNLKEGKELGQKLKYLENLWVENSFNISEKEVENTFLS